MKITCSHRAIMRKNDISAEEADNLVMAMKDQIISGKEPEAILAAEGFEMEYVFDLLY